MKLLLFTDNHYCQYSSILRKRGEKYSQRLENQIVSLNWVNEKAKEYNCDRIVCLGDFFDKEFTNSEELTALNDINWCEDIPIKFIVGNHEMGRNDLAFSSMHLFNLIPNATVINKPTIEDNICYLPYILDANREPLVNYTGKKVKIILSHNDIKDIDYGNGVIYKHGFSANEIDDICELFVNGHIHSSSKPTEKIIHIGNLTGQNFSEDAFNHDHYIMILDTDTLKYELIKNPFAYNFFKCESEKDLKKINKSNAVVSIKCNQSKVENVKKLIAENTNIIEYRIVISQDKDIILENDYEDLSVDHLQEFQKFINETLGTNSIIKEELNEVLK